MSKVELEDQQPSTYDARELARVLTVEEESLREEVGAPIRWRRDAADDDYKPPAVNTPPSPDDEAWRLDVPIVTIEQFASAGPGDHALDDFVGPDSTKLQMRVRGDSMEHADIKDGDWLVFDTAQRWPDSGIVVGEIDGRVYVKYGRPLSDDSYALYRRPGRDRLPGVASKAYRVVQVRRDT